MKESTLTQGTLEKLLDQPFTSLIGLELDETGDGRSECSLLIDSRRHHNSLGVTHGAIMYALADTGMGIALYTTLEPGQFCMTLEIKFNYYRPAVQDRLHCTSRILNRGGSVANLESRLYVSDELTASANGHFAIRNARKP